MSDEELADNNAWSRTTFSGVPLLFPASPHSKNYRNKVSNRLQVGVNLSTVTVSASGNTAKASHYNQVETILPVNGRAENSTQLFEIKAAWWKKLNTVGISNYC